MNAITSHRILLVEDNETDEELTLRALRRSGISNEVVVARDGAEAIEYLEREPAPRVVFLDLKLPKVDGLDVLRIIRARERTRGLPVVVLTSSSQDDDLEQAYARGASSYVVKPVGSKQFAETVRELGHYWLELNRSP